jgi:hypothetical protein
MSDSFRRALRGLIQIGFVQACIVLYQAFSTRPLTADQVQAITFFVTPILAFGQNALEDSGAIPAMIKK